MQCILEGDQEAILISVAALSAFTALILFGMVSRYSFSGKRFYALTSVGVIWTLLCVGFETASVSADCQLSWAMLAWWGNATVPIAWCFFVCAYVEDSVWAPGRRSMATAIGLPLVALSIALTNPYHNLVYTETSVIPAGETRVRFDHGPAYYAIIATLYCFVVVALVYLTRAFLRARQSVRPLLLTLSLITISPLLANLAYAGFGQTAFGLDPTAPTFLVGVLIFTWQLATSTTMDMSSAGQSVLFDELSEPVVFLDSSFTTIRTNLAAERYALRTTAEALLRHATRNELDKMLTSNLDNVTSEGRIFEPRIRQIESPLNPSKASLGWNVTFIDVTEQVAASMALERALQLSKEANRNKDEFISMVSHEIRTPLTSLRGGLALALSESTGELATLKRQTLEIAQRNSLRLARMIDNLLLAQTIDIGSLQLGSDEIELSSLLMESFEENRYFAMQRGVSLVSLRTDRPGKIIGDAFAIRQIIDNVLSNAIKFSPEDGVVQGQVETIKDQVRLSIIDAGQGIPDGMEERVFARFDRIESDTHHTIQGSGLGLYISRHLAQRMNGQLSYVSRDGVGTCFMLEFPSAVTTEDSLVGGQSGSERGVAA